MIVDTIFMLAQSASAATAESSGINQYLLSALISAGVALLVTCISIFVQIKNTNKSIKAAAENLERTLKLQQEIDENKRQHDTLLKNQDILLSKFDELIQLFQELDSFFYNLDFTLIQPIEGTIYPNLPKFKKFPKLQSLGTIYFSENIQSKISNLNKVHDEIIFQHMSYSYQQFMSYQKDRIIQDVLDKFNTKDYSKIPVITVMDTVFNYFFLSHYKKQKSEEEVNTEYPRWIPLRNRFKNEFKSTFNAVIYELEQLPIKKQYKLGYRVTHPDEQ